MGKEDEDDDPGGDGDGQYHYPTIWMFAVNRMACATRARYYNDIAAQLAKAIHPRFACATATRRGRVYTGK